MRSRLFLALFVLALGTGPFDFSQRRVDAQAPPSALSFTTAQAERGAEAYAEQCASCHGPNLDDGAFGPALSGVDFRQRWAAPLPLFASMNEKMPPARPGSLGEKTYADLLAFILQENGLRPSERELPEADVLAAVSSMGWPRPSGGGIAPGVTLPPPPARPNPLDRIRPVTEAMLTRPPDGEWLTWRRTYDAFGFSPLKTIHRGNVNELRVAWSWALPTGPTQAPPLVHDGVMFVYGYGDYVQALDAATGDLLWQYSRRLPKGVAPSIKRGLAIYGTMLYVPTSDAHLVALDVKSGKVAWDRAVADTKAGYRLSGGPLVARGKVMIGTQDTGGRSQGGNFILGLDAETGAESWRFYTIARPGEPGGNSWNGLPLEKRNGGSVWIPPSYDAVHNLVLFGTGNTYDTVGLRDLVKTDGVTNDALYLDSTLAINPETGKLAWHFQHQANGQWDLDWAFERQVMQIRVNGQVQTVVVTAGKQMIFDLVEAETGKYLSSIDHARELGLQNVVTAIDPRTGAKIVDESLVPGDGRTKTVCPHVDGGRDWMPSSFDAASKTLYMPWVEACMDLVPVAAGERGSLTTGVRWTVRPKAGTDGKYGRVEAINVETGKSTWVMRQRAPVTSGVLATAGGLVFAGGLDRVFSAYDAQTGTLLWSARLNEVPASVPITYTAGNQQYIATIVGAGGSQSTAYATLVPEIRNPTNRAATIWVFQAAPQGGR
jgi:PQQ-dependent dehydrogenase (methanol/ethanol family)